MIELVLLLVCILVFSSLGKRMLRWTKLEFSSFWEEILFSFGLGTGTLSFFTLLMALAGVLYRWVFLILFGVLLVALLPDMVKITRELRGYLRRSRLGRIGRLNKIFLAIAIVHIALTLLGALAPPTHFDALGVHLHLPKVYIENHKSTFIPAHQQALFPTILMDMFYTIGLMLKGDILAKLFNFSMNIALILAIYTLAERLYSKAIAFLSIGIYSSIQLINWLATTAYTDLGFSLYVFLAIYAYLNWLYTNMDKHIYLSAIFLGFSLSTKYLGVVHIGLVGTFILINYLMRKGRIVKSLKRLALFIIIPLLISSPCYIRNGFWLGNPFWPALYDVFGGSYFSQSLGREVRLNSGIGPFLKLKNKDIVSFIKSPWYKTVRGGRGTEAIGPFFFIFLPSLVSLLLKRSDKSIKFLISYSFIIYLIVYLTSHFTSRYLCSILPLLSIACAYAAEELKKDDWILKKVLPVFLILPMGFNILLTTRQVYSVIPVVLGRQSRFEYLSKPLLHPYGGMRSDVNVKVWKSMKGLLPKDARLYLPLVTTLYYADVPIDRELISFADYSVTEEILKKLGITHILTHGVNEYPLGKGIECRLIRTYKEVYARSDWDDKVSLYEIIYND